jgi:PDZ domain/Sortilin, neurotensin receptor 3,
MKRPVVSAFSLSSPLSLVLYAGFSLGLALTVEAKTPLQEQPVAPAAASAGQPQEPVPQESVPEAKPADPAPQTPPPATQEPAPAAVAVPATQEPTPAAAAALPPATQEPATAATEKRLDAIEKLLSELSKELKQSRGVTTTPAPVVSSSAAASTTADQRRPGRPDPNLDPPPSIKLDSTWLEEIKWRSIGPANMSGRITDIAVHEKDSSLWWIATASGGLLKSINHGGSMQHLFDREKVVSIGSIATDPNNKEVLWVGTGEINPRNSVSYGNGVYKTVDGGKTFQHLGLDRTYQIARILVDPKNSDTVYVGAAGRLYGKNAERGVYKTTDGGKSWQQVLFVDDQTGVIDMVMNPQDPNHIVVAMWDRMRDGFDSWPGTEPKPDGIDGYDPIRKWGSGGGLFSTTDGGKNWTKLSKGLPTMTGRIGLDWQLGSPHVLYAIIDCEEIGKGPKPFPAFLGIVGDTVDAKAVVTQLLPDSPAAKAGVKVGDQITAIEGENISDFDQLLDVLRVKKVGSKIGLSIKSGSDEKAFEILLTGRPGTNQQNTSIFLGITGQDKEGKITVQRVVESGPAKKAGINVGDVIAKLEGKEPASFRAMMDELQKKANGDKVQLEVLRGEEKLDLTVTLELLDHRLQLKATSSLVFKAKTPVAVERR